MWTKPYGSTGKDVSVIGFGGMRFPNPQDIDGSAELAKYAYQKGVNYFDTAPFYCQDKSEEIMGAAFADFDRDSYYCSSKCGAPDGAAFRESLERSLRRLGVEYIDFFHVWCVVTLEQWQQRIDGGAVAAAIQAKQEGLVKHIVVSSHLPGDELATVLAQGPFEGVTLGYCAINFPYREQALHAAADKSLGVVTMNPLGGGLIPNNPERFDFLRGPDDPDVVTAALRFNVSHDAITSALVGFSTTEHVDQAVAAVENFRPYPSEHIDVLHEKAGAELNELCTGCRYCLPCPAGVNIPVMMDAYNKGMLRGDDMGKTIRNELKFHWNTSPEAAQACTLCGKCEDQCTQHLPIRERIKHIASLADEQQ
jgi:hypothetical protein